MANKVGVSDEPVTVQELILWQANWMDRDRNEDPGVAMLGSLGAFILELCIQVANLNRTMEGVRGDASGIYPKH